MITIYQLTSMVLRTLNVAQCVLGSINTTVTTTTIASAKGNWLVLCLDGIVLSNFCATRSIS